MAQRNRIAVFFSDAQLFNLFIVLSTALSLGPAGVTFLTTVILSLV